MMTTREESALRVTDARHERDALHDRRVIGPYQRVTRLGQPTIHSASRVLVLFPVYVLFSHNAEESIP